MFCHQVRAQVTQRCPVVLEDDTWQRIQKYVWNSTFFLDTCLQRCPQRLFDTPDICIAARYVSTLDEYHYYLITHMEQTLGVLLVCTKDMFELNIRHGHLFASCSASSYRTKLWHHHQPTNQGVTHHPTRRQKGHRRLPTFHVSFLKAIEKRPPIMLVQLL